MWKFSDFLLQPISVPYLDTVHSWKLLKWCPRCRPMPNCWPKPGLGLRTKDKERKHPALKCCHYNFKWSIGCQHWPVSINSSSTPGFGRHPKQMQLSPQWFNCMPPEPPAHVTFHSLFQNTWRILPYIWNSNWSLSITATRHGSQTLWDVQFLTFFVWIASNYSNTISGLFERGDINVLFAYQLRKRQGYCRRPC